MTSKVLQKCRYQGVRLIHSSSVAVTRINPVIDSILRVDHAGELGADRIYAGQMAILGKSKMGPVIQHMWDQEKVHKETFEKLIVKYRARPTVMVPIWNVAGFLLGAGTALMGEKAAMACTVAVESVIVDHYNDQLRTLMAESEKNKELMETIQKFRDEEQEHHDAGLDHGAEQAPFYRGLTEVIKLGCKTAIAISKGLLPNRSINYMTSRSYCTSAQTEISDTKSKWDLYAAVCLERKPVVLKEFNAFEKKYYNMLQEIEVERSLKSNHEIKLEEDARRLEALKNELLPESELLKVTSRLASEFEDMSNKEFNEFSPAPRTTEADKMNDLKSTQRKLDSSLLLVVQNERNEWGLPQELWKEGETLRMTAERALQTVSGNSLKVTFMGNAPVGHYRYIYPKSLKLAKKGAKIFFFKANFSSGSIICDKNSIEFQWATQSELENLVKNRTYYKRIMNCLVRDIDYVDEAMKIKASRKS